MFFTETDKLKRRPGDFKINSKCSDYESYNHSSFFTLCFSTPEASRILIQYKITSGIATKNWLVQSGEGVITAATPRMTPNANLKYFFNILGIMNIEIHLFVIEKK